MTRLLHFYGLNHLHYLTTSTYRRGRLFDSNHGRGAACRPLFVQCRERRVGQALPLHRRLAHSELSYADWASQAGCSMVKTHATFR